MSSYIQVVSQVEGDQNTRKEEVEFPSIPNYGAARSPAFPNVTHLEVSMVPHFIQAILEGHSALEVQTIVSALPRRRDNGHPIQRLLAKHYMPDSEAFREVVELLPYIDTWQAPNGFPQETKIDEEPGRHLNRIYRELADSIDHIVVMVFNILHEGRRAAG
ncbi:hypothetical protein FIBSPDRAFT_891924 [Athelia psychrophila]|uniref:Uncharacterized protein n=1 Tax=Athelia psychrophila TaxID=1759441 RepID=A0A166J1T3_9AGAM|nr:hypothetical protein FIBSPDRAFT_891924 [Fibularhizoctonia sp. CBS 109695]